MLNDFNKNDITTDVISHVEALDVYNKWIDDQVIIDNVFDELRVSLVEFERSYQNQLDDILSI